MFGRAPSTGEAAQDLQSFLELSSMYAPRRIKHAVQIVSVLAYGLLAGDPQYNFDTGVNASLRKIDHSNKCWCSGGCEVVEKTGASRDLLK